MRVDLAGFTRGSKEIDHRAFLGFCERMDRLGYDGIWFNEFHFQQPPDPYPSPLLLASAILARTERLRVGASIMVLPIHHPLLLAEQVAQLHAQSGGRFDFGIGRGTHPDTLAALGVDPATTRQRFEEAFALIRAAWAGPAGIAAGGAWPATTRPVGPLLPAGTSVPVYVAGSTPETVGLAIRHRLPLLLSLEPPEDRQLALHRQLAPTGTPVRAFSISRYVTIAASRAAALEAVDALLPRLHARRQRFAALRKQPPDTVPPIDRDAFLARQMIAGSAEDCRERIVALRHATGIDAIRLIFNCNGEIPDDEAEAGATRFAREVLPALRTLPPIQSFSNPDEAET